MRAVFEKIRGKEEQATLHKECDSFFNYRESVTDVVYRIDYLLVNIEPMYGVFFVEIEVIVPIREPALLKSLRRDVLELMLKDNCQSWDLQADGKYIRRRPTEDTKPLNSQMVLLAALAG